MRVDSLTLKAFKEDRQLCARASILTALLVITALGVALAYTSTPCYHFLVSHQGIVSSLAVGVGLVALMVFWDKSEVKKRVTTSVSSTVQQFKASPSSKTTTLQPPPRVPEKPLKWDIVEIRPTSKMRYSYVEKEEVSLLMERLREPRTYLPIYEEERGEAFIIVDERGVPKIGSGPPSKDYKRLALHANAHAFPLNMGDLEVVVDVPSEDSLQTLGADEIVNYQILLLSRSVPLKSALIYRFQGKIMVMLDGNNREVKSLEEALFMIQKEGYSPLFVRKKELKRDWEKDPTHEEGPPHLDEAEVHRVFESLNVLNGSILLIRNRDTRELEYWKKSEEGVKKVTDRVGYEFRIRTKNIAFYHHRMLFRDPSLPFRGETLPVWKKMPFYALGLASSLGEEEWFEGEHLDGGRYRAEGSAKRNSSHTGVLLDRNRVYVVSPLELLPLTCSKMGFDVRGYNKNWHPVREVVSLSSALVRELERVSLQPLTVTAFFERGEKHGYSAIIVNAKGVARKLPLQKNLEDLNALLPKEGYGFLELKPKTFNVVKNLKVSGQPSTPLALSDDEIAELKSKFEQGIFGKDVYLFYLQQGQLRFMAFRLQDGRSVEGEARTPEPMRSTSLRELFLNRQNNEN